MNRRSLILGAVALSVSGCAAAPRAPSEPTRPLTLVSAFEGRTTGRGVFRIRLTGDERRFTARLNGIVTGKAPERTLTVTEDFVFDDGQEDRLTWVFRETAAGRWSGKREDTVGEAEVIESDGVIRLVYTADFRSPSGVTRLGFRDIIYAGPDDTIINDGVVSRWGLPVADVRFVIRRA
jgi:hypothetical protein